MTTMELGELLNTNSTVNAKQENSTLGKILIYTTGGVALLLTCISAPFVSPALRKICLPYVPATDTQIKNVLEALSKRKGSLIDIGSGDGRIVLETARNGFKSYGIEMNPWLVIYSKFSSFKNNLQKHTTFYKGDLWKHELKNYENIVIFGVKEMMEEFECKLKREVVSGTRVVACRFPLPNQKPDKTIGYSVDTVWVYTIQK